MAVRYVTIEREYGSGGTEIAALTAKTCGIPAYGREIMEQVSRRQKVSVEELERYEESVSGSLLYSLFVMSQSQTGDPDLLSQEAKLFVAETREIRALADSGPAIFVGHCASEVLREREGVLRVFIRADEDFKRRRAVEEYRIPERQVSAVCRRFNQKRANYYGFCTRKKWNDLSNYDVVLDSSRLGLEACAAALTALYRAK